MSSRLKKLTAASILFAACASVAWGTFPGSLIAAGETRTLSLYHVHTKEALTITYKKNGRYIPSALEKINYVLRDWRRNEVITIDPKTIDLMWELHADLRSNAPIHIICGYRSASTNGMLKKIGRNVAKQSMHIRGKAIDLYFPDVPVAKLRGSAIVRQIGGVGYYPRSGSSGFVHIDTGKVRYWPRPSDSQLAQMKKDFKKTVGARLTNGYMTAQVETAVSAEVVKPSGNSKVAAVAYTDAEDEESEATASPAEEKPAAGEGVLASGYPVPKPRPKPIEVLLLAAAKMHIEPASAPPPRTNFAKRRRASSKALPAASAEKLLEADLIALNPLKNSFAARAQHEQTDLVTASVAPGAAAADDFFWWPTRWLLNATSLVRRDAQGEPVDITFASMKPADQPPVEKASNIPWGLGDFVALIQGIGRSPQEPSGKADSLFVNRNLKGDIKANSRRDQIGQIDVVVDASVNPSALR